MVALWLLGFAALYACKMWGGRVVVWSVSACCRLVEGCKSSDGAVGMTAAGWKCGFRYIYSVCTF